MLRSENIERHFNLNYGIITEQQQNHQKQQQYTHLTIALLYIYKPISLRNTNVWMIFNKCL